MGTKAGGGADYSAIGVKGIIGDFYEQYEEQLGGSWAMNLGWLNADSDQETESYKWLGMSPAMREWVGSRVLAPLRTKGYTITNKTYEATIALPKVDKRRDKTGQLDIRIADLVRRSAEHWEKILTTLILAGESDLCYDGIAFFSASHTEGSSGTQKNLLTSSEVGALNVSSAAAPTVAEMVDVILGLVSYMLTYKDDQGEPMNGSANRFTLMCKPDPVLGSALGAVNDAFVASGRSNTLQSTPWTVDVLPNPRLTDNTEIYLFRTDSVMKPFILQEEAGLEVSFLGEGSDEAFKNRRYLFGVESDRNVGFGLWQYGIKATLS